MVVAIGCLALLNLDLINYANAREGIELNVSSLELNIDAIAKIDTFEINRQSTTGFNF